MKFSFAKNKIKQKPSDAFQSALSVQTDDTDPIDASLTFREHYQSAIAHAEESNFSKSLRSFDAAIRFWGIYLEQLRSRYPLRYKQFKFIELNTCDASNYFLHFKKKNKQNQRQNKKKKLWKPPQTRGLHETHNENENDNDEIIYFDDTDSDQNEDIDLIETEQKMDQMELTMDDEIEKWEKSLLNHREIGSKMYEYHGQVLLEMDRDFEAIKACQSAILLNNLNAINWLTLSRSELNFGDPFQSLSSISRAIELDYENDEIVEQYSKVYVICNKLNEMKKSGKINDNVLKRRMCMSQECKHEEIKSIKQRLNKHKESTYDTIQHKNRKTETQHIAQNYQNRIKLTKNLDI